MTLRRATEKLSCHPVGAMTDISRYIPPYFSPCSHLRPLNLRQTTLFRVAVSHELLTICPPLVSSTSSSSGVRRHSGEILLKIHSRTILKIPRYKLNKLISEKSLPKINYYRENYDEMLVTKTESRDE